MKQPEFPVLVITKDSMGVFSKSGFLKGAVINPDGMYSIISPTKDFYDEFYLLDKNDVGWRAEVTARERPGLHIRIIVRKAWKTSFRLIPHEADFLPLIHEKIDDVIVSGAKGKLRELVKTGNVKMTKDILPIFRPDLARGTENQ